MNYYSLNKKAPSVTFREATIAGQAPDKGLYFPEVIPALPFLSPELLRQYTPEDIAFQVMKPYVGDTIPDDELKKIAAETINFNIPLVRLTDNIFVLELFHGPTMAFKDVGARFMSRCLGYFSKTQKKRIVVLVATSGDTGGAVADGFYGVDGIDVVILYPSGKVSTVQEQQLTTFGGNIHALEVNGDFDDCQTIVKQAFADEDLRQSIFMTSANSINVARWLPQQIYYYLALRQWLENELPVISVPSGNFGNICAGILASQSGLPVDHFIAACNANDVVPRYLSDGKYQPMQAVATISNAMDVGNPSNFVRIMEIFGNTYPLVQRNLSSISITDAQTVNTITRVFNQYGYVLDPHGAVGFAALEKYLAVHPDKKGIILETAHPIKFPESIFKATGQDVALPPQAVQLIGKEKKAIRIQPSYAEIKDYLLRQFGHLTNGQTQHP